ncbi:MAG: restriction endonuclease subunit S, partial [Methanothrix soehngenii]|uniref:restriction endonuclease subunit S n=1 Tax=Methanothrix soehngenii TaxID=2223 RepID=UPI003141021E
MKEELPSDWKRERLEKLCLKTSQKDPRKDPETPFIYVDVSSISTQSFSIVEAKSLIGKNAPSRARKLIRKDDIIFATVRPTLKRVAIISDEFDNQICSTGYCVLRPNKMHLFPPFLYFQLLTEKTTNRVAALQKGATYPAISDSDLFSQLILLPPLPEQRAIARALRAVQAARETRLREIALERERKAALMEHLFTHGTRGEPTKMTEIGEMPEGWKTPKLADLAEIQSGGTPLRNHHEYYNGSINWAKTLDLNDGIVRSTEEKITDLGFHSIRGKIRPIDTVMVAMYGGSGTVGKSGILGIPAATNQAVCCIEPNFERFDSLYLLYYLIHFRPNWMRYAIGTRKDPNISKGIIESLKIPLPPLGQQKEISRTIKACDTKITALGQEACLLDELFR